MIIKFIFVFFISFFITFLITPAVRKFGLKLKALDRPSPRKIHRKVVTRVGGLGIYIGFMAAVSTVFLIDTESFFSSMYHELIYSQIALCYYSFLFFPYQEFSYTQCFQRIRTSLQ